MAIRVNLEPLETTEAFPYFVHTVLFRNRDWSDLYGNLSKAHWRWGVVAKVLMKTGVAV